MLQNILFNENAARNYLLEHNIINDTMQCPKCNGNMTMYKERWTFCCRKRNCNVERSMYTNTFFSGSKLKANEIFLLLRLWQAQVSVSSAINLTGHSEKTVVAFFGYFRQLVSSSLEENDTVVGGEGIVVEVDETKLGIELIQGNANTTVGIASMECGVWLV
jgi:hypothetical protein